MNKLLILISFFLFSSLSYSQLYVRASAINPLFNDALSFRNTVSIESGLQGDYTDKFRGVFGVSLTNYKPRIDTFNVYSSLNTGYSTIVNPGKQRLRYTTLNFNFGFDVTPVEENDFRPFFGLDFILGCYYFNEYYYVENSSGGDYSTLGISLGGRGRFGLEMQLSETITLFTSANFQILYNIEPSFFMKTVDFGLGCRYQF